jgi:hypothetical protein
MRRVRTTGSVTVILAGHRRQRCGIARQSRVRARDPEVTRWPSFTSEASLVCSLFALLEDLMTTARPLCRQSCECHVPTFRKSLYRYQKNR